MLRSPWPHPTLRQTRDPCKRRGLFRRPLDPARRFGFVPATFQQPDNAHADRTQDARSVADDGGRHARQMAGQGRRHGQLGRHHRRDRDRQGDDGVRSGRRRHDRQDPGRRRHRRGEGRHRDRDDRGRGRGCVRRCRAAAPAKAETPAPAPEGRRPPSLPPRPKAAARPRRRRPRPPARRGRSRKRATASRPRPLARRLAEAQGIDLASLKGTGPGGRIVKADLGSAAGGARLPRAASRCAAPAAAPSRSRSNPTTSRTKPSSSATCARRSRAA